MTRFGQILTAMVTPFDSRGDVNYAVAEKLADHLIHHGTDTVVVCGTTGESPTLTWEEEYELFHVVKQVTAGKAQIMAGTGSNSTREAISATQKAASLGVDAALLVVPYYNKPPQEGLYQHFRAIAEAVPELPMMLYNVPSRTSRSLDPDTVARLAQIDNIVAIKQASSDLEQASHIRRLTPPTFELYSGEDALTLPLLAVGAVGVVSVASHLVGEQLQQMVTAFAQGRPQEATAIHLQLLPLVNALFATTNPIPIKAALRLQGWDVGATRLPLSPAPDQINQRLRQVLSDLTLL